MILFFRSLTVPCRRTPVIPFRARVPVQVYFPAQCAFDPPMTDKFIRIQGARQNNLRSVDLDLPLNELIVVTGVSGSGKSSLAFDTVYSEGQRRYVETFSPYARQFLDRMDKPQVERIDGIPPAIAIDQTNPVRTSRSTVGTMTELNDHVKLLYARAATLYCRNCGREVRRDDAESIYAELIREPAVGGAAARVLVTFTVTVPENFSTEEIETFLARQGYTRIHARAKGRIEVIQDRLAFNGENRARLVEALEAALKLGRGHATVRLADAPERAFRFSAHRHCAACDIAYADCVPNSFSFNSPVGACEQCRGFGRTIGIDYRLVIPDDGKTLAGGAIKPWQTKSNQECQDDLLRFARQRGVPTNTPWRELTAEQRAWVIEGEGSWRQRKWYGVARFFAWLESKAYKMHVRVLLSKYRSYDACPACGGARLKPESLLWRLGTLDDASAVMAPAERFRAHVPALDDATFAALPGLIGARPDVVADRALARVLRAPDAAATARRGCRAGARRDPEPAALPRGRRPLVPDARSPVAHAVRRRGAADQSDDGARHVAREHAVRAR